MGVANIDRKETIGAIRHIGWLLLRLSFCVGLLNLVWVFPKSAFGAEPAATTTVLVYNQAGVSRSILAAAEREAGRILDAAGVRIIWVECPMRSTTASAGGPCLRELNSTDIMLRVLSPLAHHGLKADVFGFAIGPILASVYCDYAVHLAVEEEYVECSARSILGCVIAHELGHLLLGSNSHSSAGIMQSPWGEKQVREALNGTLLFTAEQAKRMRAETRTRMESQTRSPKEESVGTADQQAPPSLIH